MSNNDEILVISSDNEEDESIPNNDEILVISSDSEEGEPIPNVSDEGSTTEDEGSTTEDELEHEQTRRGEKRQNVNLSDSEDEPFRKRKNQNVVSSDTDPIPNVSDEGTTEEDEQTGQGKNVKPRTRTWNKRIIIASNPLRIIIHKNLT